MAAQEYAQAARVLAGTATLLEAAKFYAKHHPVRLPHRGVAALVEEMLEAKRVDGMSERYIDDLDNRLERFADKFVGPGIADLATAEMQQWLNGLGLGHRGRNNFRATIVALFNFAKSRGYLPKNQPTEADGLSKAKGEEAPIGIFTPDELSKLLSHADESLVPYYSIGAFAGLRTAELQRLIWSEIKLEQGYIEVTAKKAKTAQRRLVPIQPNLALWLQPYVEPSGRVFKLSTVNQKATDFARRVGIEWPPNGLRHSYGSYRLASCKSVGEVALEMGNSTQMIFRHYRELVTPADAEKWWKICPDPAGL
jgi:integrase